MASLNTTASEPGNNNTITNMATTTTTTTTGKKKFGKNLNKLTKPPAPPAASGTSKTNAASRNGLLLLSTNKRNSSSGPSNGLLASKPSVAAPLPSLGLQYESTTSTHDVLLGAVVGAAARAEHTPDAWGVAAAANNSSNNNNTANSGNVNGTNHASVDARPPVQAAKSEAKFENTQSTAKYTSSHPDPVAASSNWDEYGGRDTSGSRGLVSTATPPSVVLAHHHGDNYENDHSGGDEQKAVMAKLARERAERRRQEEEARVREQKEKAAQRLRELESKLEDPSQNSNSRRGVVLEPLGGGGGSGSTGGSNHSNQYDARPKTQRTLYDPNNTNRTFSSTVGGAAKDAKNQSATVISKNSQASNGGASISSRDDHSRGNGDDSPGAGATPGGYKGPVIHLNSYEDRDRGEAPRAAAPRMLFDPKSGSMVAVPSRDDAGRGGGGGKNSNTKGGRGGGRSGRGNKASDDNENNNARGVPKKSKTKLNKKDRQATGKGAAKASSSKTVVVSERKLPRTRGVLYARDEKGIFYCADGCDADLGYGSHSVPGGRARNPEAYAKFVEQQQQMYKEQAPSKQRQQQQHERDLSSERYDGYDFDHQGHSPYEATDELETGYHSGYHVSGGEFDEPEQPTFQMDWVKPNEKIELVTGMDDESPTLQATAREWAPSQAALAAAAQVAALPSLGSQDEEDSSGYDNTPNLEPRGGDRNFLLHDVSDDEDDDDVPVSIHICSLKASFSCFREANKYPFAGLYGPRF